MFDVVIRQRRPALVGVSVAVVAAALVTLTAGASPSAPTSPSAHSLAQSGIVATPLNQTEPVSAQQAIAALTSAPYVPTPPVASELVTFSEAGARAFETPQPAWLISWREVSYAPGGGIAPVGQTPPPIPSWSQMNAVVSAVTGKMLVEFPSGQITN